MKLLTKLSLLIVILVSLTGIISIFFSINSIKVILYDLNSQLVQKDLDQIHQFIHEEYKSLEQHGLQDVKGYYQKVLIRIQNKYQGISTLDKGDLIIIDSRGEKILHSGIHELALDWDEIIKKHKSREVSFQMEYLNSTLIWSGENKGELEYFYQKIPEWDLGLLIALERKELLSRLDEYIKAVSKAFIVVLLVALLSGFYFSQNLVSQIKEALVQIQAVKKGHLTAKIENVKGNDEISELKSGLNSMTEIIYEKMLKQALAELKNSQSKKSLQEQHALLSAFINAMPELAFILNEEGEYIKIFGNNKQHLDRQKELLIGKNLNDILPKPVAIQIMQTISLALETQETQILEYELMISEVKNYFLGYVSNLVHKGISNNNKKMVIWIANDITEQTQAKKEAHKLSLFDPLTELPNRRLLLDRLDQEIARAKRHDQLGALLFIDLDNFKNINDSCGHRIGDIILQKTAARLNGLLRKEDLACRLGGDEFVIMLCNLSNKMITASSQAQVIAHKILDIIQVPYELDSQQHQMSCSIGIVLFPEGEDDSHDLIQYADIAMYHAKEEGKNTVSIFARHMQKILENQLQLQNDLRIALKEKMLTVHFQPQYNDQGAIISAEALVRWQHSERGFISPAEFIPIAEESGLIHELGRLVMEKVFQVLQSILEERIPSSFKRIAINVSPWQFGRTDYIDEVKSLLGDYQISAEYLEIEITEQTLVGNFSVFSEKMKQMQEMGIRFSIDDFGTGYSSLSYLKSLPVNMLKIDYTFIRDVTIDKNDDAIVKTIIDMAENLDLDVIAEGVETQEQLDFLRANDCLLYQGYFFSRPIPADAFIALLVAQVEDSSMNTLS